MNKPAVVAVWRFSTYNVRLLKKVPLSPFFVIYRPRNSQFDH